MSKTGRKNKDYVMTKIVLLKRNGRKEITTKKQLEKFPIGSAVSFMNKKNIFRLGGFITKFNSDDFIYVGLDFKTRYRVRYEKVLKMWVGNVYMLTNDVVSLTKTTNKKSNFPVKINGIIIYYAKNNYDVLRFKTTDRYKTYMNWCEYFKDRC